MNRRHEKRNLSLNAGYCGGVHKTSVLDYIHHSDAETRSMRPGETHSMRPGCVGAGSYIHGLDVGSLNNTLPGALLGYHASIDEMSSLLAEHHSDDR